jgi:2-keto-3-deoxy-L-rhamnonate aldolase RhmA
MLAGKLKAKLKNNGRPVGMIMTFDFWPGYIELAKKYGLDFIVIDMEHGQIDLSQAVELCRIGRLTEMPTLIRPALCEFDRVRRSLEIGAAGLMLPWVERQEQLDVLKEAAFSPPKGRHGMGGPAIWAVDGVGSNDWKMIEDNTFIMCQVETPAGVEFTPTIASQEWIDAVMLGPYDLALNMGLVDSYMKDPRHIKAIESVRDKAHGCGKPAGMVVGTGADARYWFDNGFDIIILGEASGHFRKGLADNLAELNR